MYLSEMNIRTRFGQPINLTAVEIYLHIFAFQIFISTAKIMEPSMEILINSIFLSKIQYSLMRA